MKLALGTVQFGMPYGVTNHGVEVTMDDIEAVLSLAASAGIDTLDTAIGYGEAEARIGDVLNGDPRFQIISKLPSGLSASDYCPGVEASLTRLRVPQLQAIMWHSVEDLLNVEGEDRWNVIKACRDAGLAREVGASFYHPSDLLILLDRFQFDIVQLPANLLDQRFLEPELRQGLTNRTIKIHLRSLFLQGVLITSWQQLPCYFHQFHAELDAVAQWAADLSVTPMALCLALGLAFEEVDRLVVGCCNKAQLQDILEAYKQAEELLHEPNEPLLWAQLSSVAETLILPTLWPSNQ